MLTEFRASDGWIRNFKKRHGIGEVVLHGEAGSADQVYAEIAEVGLPKILQGADPNDIYKVDETGWNYRSIPKRTLASQPRKGIKEAKDRVMAVLCCNTTGTHKFKMMIIGKLQNQYVLVGHMTRCATIKSFTSITKVHR